MNNGKQLANGWLNNERVCMGWKQEKKEKKRKKESQSMCGQSLKIAFENLKNHHENIISKINK